MPEPGPSQDAQGRILCSCGATFTEVPKYHAHLRKVHGVAAHHFPDDFSRIVVDPSDAL